MLRSSNSHHARRRVLSPLGGASLTLMALWFSACTQGGQTYDDGSDGVNVTAPRSTDDNNGGQGGESTSQAGSSNGPGPGGEDASCEELNGAAYDALDALVDQAERGCNDTSDCMRVESIPSCTYSCRNGWAISVGAIDDFEQGVDEINGGVCADLDAAECAMSVPGCTPAPPDEPRCVDGTCELVPLSVGPGSAGAGGGSSPSPSGGAGGSNGGADPGDGGATSTGECYGPDENLDQAYSGTLEGCPCSDEGDICVDGVALLCESDRWIAVEDGPCFLVDDPCDGRLASAYECVEFFDTCIELSTGLFCGRGRRTNLCDDGMLVADASGCLQDDAFCRELDNGLYCTGGSAPMCPEGYTPIDDCPDGVAWCFDYSESLSCRVPEFELAECEAAGGEMVGDPGDGSVITAGCPDGRTLLGTINGCIEGCLCCEP